MTDPLHHPIADVVVIRPSGVAWVLAGGCAGAAVRSVVASVVGFAPGGFPVATITVNLVGAFLLGWFLARHRSIDGASWMLSFVAVGVLGSLTTFSAFSVEVVHLIDDHALAVAFAYVGVSIVGGLAAAWTGERIGGGGG
jgi:fluoride exporter